MNKKLDGFGELNKSATLLLCEARGLNPYQMVPPPEGTKPYALVPVWESVALEVYQHCVKRIANEKELAAGKKSNSLTRFEAIFGTDSLALEYARQASKGTPTSLRDDSINTQSELH